MKFLKSDSDYYGEAGKAYLSNSDISSLLYDPKSFKKKTETTKELLQGQLFHWMMLEPEKAKSIRTVNASTRNTNLYKDAVESSGEEILLLTNEWQEISNIVDVMKSNLDFYEMIYQPGAIYEEPAIGEIFGLPWKGKTDILTKEYLIDLKTTSKLEDFKWSAKKYNYDSQAYVYRKLFGKPLIFLVVEKTTANLAMFECSEDFYEQGRDKVALACEQYQKFFGANATQDVNSFYLKSIL
jgi:hypothetical protein